MNVGSLFSGIGGFELGFFWEGFRTEWFIECEPYAQTILKKRFPEAQIYGDIKKVDFGKVPRVDILTGGFPCQDISNAGKRVGIEGSRSSLWKYYAEAIRQLRPCYAVIENVSALTRRGLSVVLADLAEIGYDAEWHCIPASAVGAPHRRDRIWIITYPNEHGSCSQRYEEIQRSDSVSEKWKASINSQQSEWVNETGKLGSNVSYSDSEGQQRQRQKQVGCEELSEDVENSKRNRTPKRNREKVNIGEKGTEYSGESLSTSKRNKQNWYSEPELGRVADGVSNRVDRIKCLGNAVVPQIPQIIAKAIKEKEKEAVEDESY